MESFHNPLVSYISVQEAPSILNGTFVKETSSLENSSECLKDTSNKRSLDIEDTASDSEPRKLRRTGELENTPTDSDISTTGGIMGTKQRKRKLGSKKSSFFGPV